ncbi:MAG TPA: tyrosine-type recombinase/integrase [Plantibacter sp.]|uniref:tyrosine-type recombinase/integrase n=1 Tax=Plantibacter sp. TaxID=1871045 RepID=UPI002CFDA43C|nr:tyrosine-type recombinase/integrase [Plantibacter sp.]
MPSGACVIRYDGKRGATWSVKFRDAEGRQVKETVGHERDGWNRQRAERELGKRLGAVEKGMRKPTRRTFATLAEEFVDVALASKPRKRSTMDDYRGIIRNHFLPALGHEDLGRLSQRPERLERYAAEKLAAGLSPKTVRNHLALLGLMFRWARKWRWVSENPAELVDAPPLDDAETETLTSEEVARLLAAYRQLADGVDERERYWYDAARRMTTVALSTGLRRGELLGLRWQDVSLLDQRLRVAQSFVRGEMTTPKSKAGRRTIHLGAVAIAALEEQFRASRYREPDSIVFCHEALGTPLDPSKLATYAKAAFRTAAIEKPFRPWHGLRHTALTETAAAGVPSMFVQAKAGHAQASTTERYLHANKTAYPDAAELAEARLFSG